jgi:hypothetical protein
VLAKLATHMQKNEMRSLPLTVYKKSTQRIKDLTLKSKIMKLLQENIGEILQDIGIGKDTLDRTQRHRQQK